MSTISPDAVDPPVQTAQEAEQRLNSWKEIAAYFDRDVRTAQLWEKKESLPVHRHEHNARASVYAYSSELDKWLRNRVHKELSKLPLSRTLAELDVNPEISPRPDHPVRVFFRVCAAVATVAAAIILLLSFRANGIRYQNTSASVVLAVLPFEDLSGDKSGDFLVDGLTEDLITDLERSGGAQVISRRSVMQYKGTHQPLSDIARQLHAAVILEGTAAPRNNQVRITAQLLDATNDHLIWAQDYTRKTDDLLSLQDEVAADITAAALKVMAANNSHTRFNSH